MVSEDGGTYWPGPDYGKATAREKGSLYHARLREHFPGVTDEFLFGVLAPVYSWGLAVQEWMSGSPYAQEDWDIFANSGNALQLALFIMPMPPLDDLLKGAIALDRNGLTFAGRALQKHGSRIGSAFPKVTGNSSVFNQLGQTIVEDILTAPGTTFTRYARVINGKTVVVIDAIAVDGRGIRFDALTGTFIGFLEP